jgi:hypothetical protein
MIHRFVKLEFSRKELPAVRTLFANAAPHVRDFEGCEYLEILFDVKQRGKVITYSHWQSLEHLDAYRHSPVFQDFWLTIKPHFTKPAEAWSMHRGILLP